MIRNGCITMKLRHLSNHWIGANTVQPTFTDGSLFGDGSILAILSDIETEGGVSWESLSVHPGEDWALSVDVIVDFNRRFSIHGSQDPTNVLDDSSSKGNWKRHKYRIERRTIESLTEKTAGRDKHEPASL